MDWNRQEEQIRADPRARESTDSVGGLDEFDQIPAARRLARLEADTALMRRLQAEGFEGDVWREVAEALVDYGFQVMRAWVVTGQVFAKLAEKRKRVPTPPLGGIPRADAQVLAQDTVADAIVDFRDRVLRNGQWASVRESPRA